MKRRVLAGLLALCSIVIIVAVTFYVVKLNQPQPGPPNLPTRIAGSPTVTGTTPPTAKCGVKKNTDGSYTFPQLHVSASGLIVTQTGCQVPLVGFNMGALGLADASGATTIERINWYKQNFKMNMARVNFNSQWWNDDVFVPKANMHYRQWLQTYVGWQEQNGNYVQLDLGPHFPEPPCGGTVTLCPAQNQGDLDYKARPDVTTAAELETNIAPGIQAWTDIAKIYANDPAIIYDAWNEPTLSAMGIFFKDMNALIDAIRTQSPNALVVVFGHGWKQIVSGLYPNYKQPNLVMDAHIYDGFNGISPATGQNCSEPGGTKWTPAASGFANNVKFAHSHGQAVIINEWGGCYDEPGYHNIIINYAKSQGIALTYFQSGNVASGAVGSLALNANGRLVQTGYASIMEGIVA